jgi:hypothetical protein
VCLCTWVDDIDILGFSTSELRTNFLNDSLNAKFGDVGLCREEGLPYIGMVIHQPKNGESWVFMTEYI